MDTGTKISLVAVSLAIVGFIATHFRTKSSADLRTDVELLKKQVALFWGIVEKEIGNMLHSPHRAELDRLIEKNVRGKLEPNELERFAELLQEMAEDTEATHGEQAAAVLLKAAVLARHAHVNH